MTTREDAERVSRRLEQYALPDPHDERDVPNAPLLRNAAAMIRELYERAVKVEADLAVAQHALKCAEALHAETIKVAEELTARARNAEADLAEAIKNALASAEAWLPWRAGK